MVLYKATILILIVKNHLIKAERRRITGTDDDEAKVEFCKSLEAALRKQFVDPLLKYKIKYRQKAVRIWFDDSRGVRSQSVEALKKMGLGVWAGVFDRTS